ncbi:hypothetical protein BBP40_000294 [Aspergillus hancockii]|nr:hypothetical protein BBP40_000294 [Aspergillus hancockii]
MTRESSPLASDAFPKNDEFFNNRTSIRRSQKPGLMTSFNRLSLVQRRWGCCHRMSVSPLPLIYRLLQYLLKPLCRGLTYIKLLAHLLRAYVLATFATEGQPPKKYSMHTLTVIYAVSVAATSVSASVMRSIAGARCIILERIIYPEIPRINCRKIWTVISHITGSPGRYVPAVR